MVGAQYATEDHWRNNSRKNEGMEPKQEQYPVVDVSLSELQEMVIDREAWRVAIRGVTKRWTQLSD